MQETGNKCSQSSFCWQWCILPLIWKFLFYFGIELPGAFSFRCHSVVFWLELSLKMFLIMLSFLLLGNVTSFLGLPLGRLSFSQKFSAIWFSLAWFSLDSFCLGLFEVFWTHEFIVFRRFIKLRAIFFSKYFLYPFHLPSFWDFNYMMSLSLKFPSFIFVNFLQVSLWIIYIVMSSSLQIFSCAISNLLLINWYFELDVMLSISKDSISWCF